MPNFITFLIIIVALLIGIKGDYIPNQLLNFGLFVILAYLFSLVMRFFKLPLSLGYILAGILAGNKGLGFLHEKFLGSMFLIESLATMILVSSVVRFTLQGQSLAKFSKYFASGALSSLGTLLLTIGFFAPLSIPLQMKIIIGLYAATFSPIMCYVFTKNDESSQHYIQTAFGGYIVAIVIWGILAPFWGQAYQGSIKLALMPTVISITSIMAGFTWVFFAEKLIYIKSNNIEKFFPLVSLFLIYPCCSIFSLDYLFVAIGVGIYYGIISENRSTLDYTEIVSLIVFGFFGITLSLESVFLLGKTGWTLVALITLCVIFSRIITLKLFLNTVISKHKSNLSTVYLIPYGPLTVIALRRFISGFGSRPFREFDKFGLYSQFTTAMMLSIVIVTVIYVIMSKITNKTVIHSQDTS